MNTVYQTYLFWVMGAALFIVPLLMIAILPPSRHKTLLFRTFMVISLLVVSILGLLAVLMPQNLLTVANSQAYFWTLVGLLAFVPIVVIMSMPQSKLRSVLINGLLWLVGAISLILGLIGVVMPVLPTTPFILLTAACWGRASPRFHRWLYRHKFFGPMVRDWEERRAIPKRGKYLAWSMMTLSSIGLIIKFPERWYVGVGTGIICLCVGLWMARLPDA